MEAPSKYYIPLGKAILLFFPLHEVESVGRAGAGVAQGKPEQVFEGCTVQVYVKQAHRGDLTEMMTFFRAQDEISKAVESIVYAHILASLPSEVCIEGEGYVLKGRRRPWTLGHKLDLRWGENPIRPCEDKWVFIFEHIPTLAQSPESDC